MDPNVAGSSPVDRPFFSERGSFVTWLQALLLGIVQGMTEFFPVSSSAHLRITKKFLGLADGEHLLYFDLMCHAGTLLALIFFMRREIKSVFSSWRQMSLFSLALTPLIPAYFFLKPVRIALSNPSFLGFFLMLTGGLLFWAARKKALVVANGPIQGAHEIGAKEALAIGAMQALALIPGISRSGSTIAAGRLLGSSWLESARFSFLLAVPTILGGEFLETIKWFRHQSDSVGSLSWEIYAIGFAASFGVGLLGVRFVFWVYERGKITPIAWYCLAIGCLSLVLWHG